MNFLKPFFSLVLVTTYTLVFPIIEVYNDNELFSINENISSYVDLNNSLSIDDVIQHPNLFSNQGKVSFGFSDLPTWFSFDISNKMIRPSDWYLEVDYNNLDSLEVYVFEGKKLIYHNVTGDHFPFDQRPLPYTGFVFPIYLKAKTNYKAYIRVHTSSELMVPMSLDPVKTFDKSKFHVYLIFGIFYGILLIMSLYNFIVGISLKDRNYLYYAGSIFFTLLFYLGYDGHAYQYFFPNSPYLNYKFVLVTLAIATIFIVMLLYCLFFKTINGSFFTGLIGIEATFTFLVSVSIYRKGKKFAKYFMLGWVFYQLSSIVLILMTLGLTPYSSFSRYAVYFGSVIELILLSRALAHKYRLIREEEITAQTKILGYQQNYNKELEKTVINRTYDLKSSNNQLKTTIEKVSSQKEVIEHKNSLIIESMQYARHIQKAIIPKKNTINALVREHFVLYKPKDIISGDIYWFKKIDQILYFASIDCTGHGVPGALLTMMAVNTLDSSIIDKEISPADALEIIDRKVRILFKENKSHDGMDIGLARFNTLTRNFSFSGAHTPCIIIENQKLIELKHTKRAIGSEFEKHRAFENHSSILSLKSTIYLFSDGYKDQFGGEFGKKLMKRKLYSILTQISIQPLEDQEEMLNTFFYDWKGQYNQVDDIIIMGLKL